MSYNRRTLITQEGDQPRAFAHEQDLHSKVAKRVKLQHDLHLVGKLFNSMHGRLELGVPAPSAPSNCTLAQASSDCFPHIITKELADLKVAYI